MLTYWAILEKMPGSKLRLTKIDDEIYQHFRDEFKELGDGATLNEEDMKSKGGKEKWRNFVNKYDKKIEDFNFGTMLRSNAKDEYEEETTIFGRHEATFQSNYLRLTRDTAVRMQFYAIEIARNKAGLNDWIYEKTNTSVTKKTEDIIEQQATDVSEEVKGMPKDEP